jgi:uncharacterized protein (TIGR02145 family)
LQATSLQNTINRLNKTIKKMKMKMKQLLIFISVMYAMNLSAQVTMGALESPHDAAVLDLSKVPSQKLGLLLPTVELEALNRFTPLPGTTDQQLAAKGMVVYNKRTLLAENIYPGVYVWDGTKWGWISMLDANCTEVTGVSFDLTDRTVTEGSYPDILITATSTPASNASAVYQWYINDVLQSSTSNTFTFPAGKPAGDYVVKALAGNACTPTSSEATATVTVLGPLPAPSIYTVFNPNCGSEAVFEVAMPFADLADVETFMWSINDGTAVAGKGVKGSRFTVPYADVTQEISVYAKTNGTRASSAKSAPVTTGILNPDQGFWLSGEVFYDIYATQYQTSQNTLKYGTNAQRAADLNNLRNTSPGTGLTKTYTASRTYGSGGTVTYAWSVSDPDEILDGFIPSTDNSGVQTITFKDITDDGRIKDQPDKALSVTLTCVAKVNGGACSPEYILTKLIEVRDRTTGCTLPSTLTATKYNDKYKGTSDATGYITFQCYNLGAEPMRISEQLDYMANPNVNNKWRNTGGASAGTSGNFRVYGDLYQWGRRADGHQKRNAAAYSYGPYTGALTDGSTGGDLSVSQIPTDADCCYSKFICSGSTEPRDWISGGGHSTCWDGVGSYNPPPANPIKLTNGNDPCPDGWRVPTRDEWRSIVLGIGTGFDWSGMTAAGENGTYNTWLPVAGSTDGNISWNAEAPDGYIVYPITGGSQTSPALFLPAAGYRYHTTGAWVYNSGSRGYYLSSTTTNLLGFNFSSSYIQNINGDKSDGRSVRCVAEISPEP